MEELLPMRVSPRSLTPPPPRRLVSARVTGLDPYACPIPHADSFCPLARFRTPRSLDSSPAHYLPACPLATPRRPNSAHAGWFLPACPLSTPRRLAVVSAPTDSFSAPVPARGPRFCGRRLVFRPRLRLALGPRARPFATFPPRLLHRVSALAHGNVHALESPRERMYVPALVQSTSVPHYGPVILTLAV